MAKKILKTSAVSVHRPIRCDRPLTLYFLGAAVRDDGRATIQGVCPSQRPRGLGQLVAVEESRPEPEEERPFRPRRG